MVKKVLYVFILSLLISLSASARYDISTPVEGDSIANDELQFEVIQTLYKKISPKTPSCTEYSIDNTQLIHYPYDVKKDKNGNYIKGYWNEIWTVNTCGIKKQYPVKFIIGKKNTIFKIENYFTE